MGAGREARVKNDVHLAAVENHVGGDQARVQAHRVGERPAEAPLGLTEAQGERREPGKGLPREVRERKGESQGQLGPPTPSSPRSHKRSGDSPAW